MTRPHKPPVTPRPSNVAGTPGQVRTVHDGGPALRAAVAQPGPRLGAMATLALMLATALMPGCGPGLGGTGTGDSVSALAAFDAQRAAPCASDLASLLGCPATTAGSPNAIPAARWLADGSPAAQVQAEVNDTELQLLLRCPGWRFDGTWGRSAELGSRWFGFLEQGGRSSLASVTGTVSGAANAAQLVLTVFDQGGRVLAGPYKLTAVPAPTQAAACGP